MNNLFGFFDNLADDFIAALVHDFQDPTLQKQLIRQVHWLIDKNIQNPMLKMIASNYIDQGLDYVKAKAAPFFKEVVLSDPPESVDASATVVKDVVNEKVDTIADRIKKELAKKKKMEENN